MRIVRLANFITPYSGGLRTALQELGAGYAAAGHEPVLVMPGAADDDEQTPQGRVITLRGPVLPLSGGYRLLLSKRRVRDLLESLRPDRLEVSDRTTLRWTGPWARRHHVPAVMVSHESVAGLLSLPVRSKSHQPPGVPDVGAAGRMIQGMARVLADTLNARTAQAYAQVVCTTRWAAAEFERLGVRNLRHVPLGVDLELFSPQRRCPQLRRYAAPGEVLIVHCGRLSVEKKPHRSIDALARLRAAGAVVLTMRLPDPGRMLGMPTALARPLAGRIRELNQIMDQLAAQFGTLHFDAAEDSQVYDRCMWSVDRLHPSERGHRHIACRFHDQLAAHGHPVGPRPGTEPTSPAPTRRDELTWMATKGTKWVLRRCTDLLPYLVAIAVRDCFRVRQPEPEAPTAVGVPETR